MHTKLGVNSKHKLSWNIISEPWAINKMALQHQPHNIHKHQVAKTFVEGDKIQDLTNHKWIDEHGDAKQNTKPT